MIYPALKSLRAPSRWAATHFLFSYNAGFAKRSLFGEVLRWTLGDQRFHYGTLATMAWLSFGALSLAIAALAARHKSVFLPLLLIGPAGSYLFLYIGYLDQLHYFLAIVAVLAMFKRPKARHLIFVATATVSFLIHEAALLTTVPLLAFASVMTVRRRDGAPLDKTQLRGEIWPLLLVLTMAILLASTGTLTTEAFAALSTNLQAKVDFRLRLDALETLRRSFGDNVSTMWNLWSNGQLTQRLKEVAPLALLFIYFPLTATRRILREHGGAKSRELQISLVVALVPLTLSLLGWDLDRWWELATLSSYLVLFITAAAVLPKGANIPWPFSQALLVVILVVGWAEPYPTGRHEVAIYPVSTWVERALGAMRD